MDIQAIIDEHQAMITDLQPLVPQIMDIAERMVKSLRGGGKILWMGNGGSAADSQHLAAELIGRYTRERRSLPSLALTTDTSILTAVGNDYGFDTVFARQVQALATSKDVVVGISTSGNSKNVLAGIHSAKEVGAYTVGFTGCTGGQLGTLVHACLVVPSSNIARIQEAHILMGHIICDLVESELMYYA